MPLLKFLLILIPRLPFQRIVAPTTTLVGIPTAAPFALAPDHVSTLFHSGATIPSMPRKRKALALDTSATLALIFDSKGKLIEDLMKMKVPPPAYLRI